MSIEKDDTPTQEVIDTPENDSARIIKKARDSVGLVLDTGNLAEQKAEVEQVCTVSEIKEERTFSREDITKLIVQFAGVNKLEVNNLKVDRVIHDEQGNLLVLEVKSPNPDGSYQIINYTIKGRHRNESKSQQSGTTSLDRSFWDKDDNFEGSNIIAKYVEGKWHFES
jgi:hypothetical protein